MKIFAIIRILFTFAVGMVTFYLKYRLNNVGDNKNLEAVIDLEVKKFIKNDPSHSLVIGVYKEGKSFIKGYGTTNKEGKAPDASTVFQIGSISKVFTAALLQILSDEGVVKIDTTLGELIGESFALSPEAERVTLRQLVTHTSGFPSIPKPLEEAGLQIIGDGSIMQNPFSHLGPQYIFDYLKTTEDKRKPGRFEYSNYGMGLLGHVLETVTKKDLEPLVAEKLLLPLDMKDTAIELTREMKNNLAEGYTADGEPSPLWTFRSLAGAGAFNSNAKDMLKFIRANIEDSSVLSRTLKKMHAPQFDGTTGTGWMQPTFLDRFFGNKTVVWHNGRVGGYASYLSIDTKWKTGVVILYNKSVDITLSMLGMILTRQIRTQSWSSN